MYLCINEHIFFSYFGINSHVDTHYYLRIYMIICVMLFLRLLLMFLFGYVNVVENKNYSTGFLRPKKAQSRRFKEERQLRKNIQKIFMYQHKN